MAELPFPNAFRGTRWTASLNSPTGFISSMPWHWILPASRTVLVGHSSRITPLGRVPLKPWGTKAKLPFHSPVERVPMDRKIFPQASNSDIT